MATLRITTEALAHLLDLPVGAEMFEVSFNDANKVYEFVANCPGWPEGVLSLTYTTDENGAVTLSGYQVL